MAELLFYLLSGAAIAFAVGVVSARSPMMSVLSLLGSFLCVAVIYLLAGFAFLAAAQILVYGGAILVLFLFVVMLLDMANLPGIEEHPARDLGPRRLAIAGGAAGLLALGTLLVLAPGEAPELPDSELDPLSGLAAMLFSRYLLPFEAASIVLLATMVAVMTLAKRRRADAAVRAEGAALTAPPSRPSPEVGRASPPPPASPPPDDRIPVEPPAEREPVTTAGPRGERR